MADFSERIDQLARLMDEFHLAEARLESDDLTIAFRRRPAVKQAPSQSPPHEDDPADYGPEPQPSLVFEDSELGMPVTSPMAGIFYHAPSPGSPPFVKEGDVVAAGQIIGLIEAMKVFNEIPCTISGTVLKQVAVGGDVVQPGDTLIRVG